MTIQQKRSYTAPTIEIILMDSDELMDMGLNPSRNVPQDPEDNNEDEGAF